MQLLWQSPLFLHANVLGDLRWSCSREKVEIRFWISVLTSPRLSEHVDHSRQVLEDSKMRATRCLVLCLC